MAVKVHVPEELLGDIPAILRQMQNWKGNLRQQKHSQSNATSAETFARKRLFWDIFNSVYESVFQKCFGIPM